MMNAIVKETEKLLTQGKIGQALDFIDNEANAIGMHQISENANKLATDFQFMLNYYAQGAQDPTRADMLAHIYDETYNLVTQLKVKAENKTCYTGCLSGHLDIQTLFDRIENNYPATADDRRAIQQIILDERTPLYLRAMTLSALTLNLFEYFDNEKFESLYTYTLDDQPIEIRIRAWVAIALVTMAHDFRISTQPRLVEQLKFMCEEAGDEDSNLLMKIQIALFQCIEAQQARDFFRKEITPDIERRIKEFTDKKGLKSTDELANDDIVPEWEEELEKSGLQEKMQDFMSMRSIGIDILYDSFIQTSHSRFFQTKCNWFLPFCTDYPDVARIMKEDDKKASFIKTLSASTRMCSTDKFSNLSLLITIPESQLKMMEEAMAARNIDHSQQTGPTADNEIVNYLHDLYRYYTIFKTQHEEYNPFARKLYFGGYAGLADVVSSAGHKKELADLQIRNKRYGEAQTILREVVKQDKSKEMMQKYAYCLLKNNPDNSDYCDTLARCNNMWPDDKWTLKHYANALMHNANYMTAEDVLHEGLMIYPDDVNMILQLAKCYISQDRYNDAMHQLHKADLLKENDPRILRNMAWCSFVLGDKANAERYIAPVLKAMPQSRDWVNGGHIALLDGNLPLAIERYKNAETDDVEFAFIDDNDKMLRAGIPQEVITLTYQVVINKLNK